MAQEEHEFLDERDFHQNVARADRQEIQQESQHGFLMRQARPQHQRRQSQDNQCGHQANRQQLEQQRHGDVDLVIGAVELMRASQNSTDRAAAPCKRRMAGCRSPAKYRTGKRADMRRGRGCAAGR